MAFEELTSRQAVMWGSAPFENIAELISEMHLALVERLDPADGDHWLDLACGAGDVAFQASRAGATVTGSDLSPTLVETARRRAAKHGLDLTASSAATSWSQGPAGNDRRHSSRRYPLPQTLIT
jgi:2-polyprenyl-3-methyl-5-hydroxy-6-metoxy-1,4-benzoquinol methylase